MRPNRTITMPKLAMGDFLNFCQTNVKNYEQKVLPMAWKRTGIWFSEGFFICSIFDFLDVDIIIESGLNHGISTEQFVKYGIPLVSIERDLSTKKLETQWIG